MGQPDLRLEPELRAEVTAFLEPRAAAVDGAGAALLSARSSPPDAMPADVAPGGGAIREGLAFLNERALSAAAGPDGAPNADLVRVAETIATAAWCDMATAFSLWCHRMVLEYLSCAPPGSPLRTTILPRVRQTQLLGSTALAAAMAHHVGGTPLPVRWRSDGRGTVVDGRVTWASNLFPPDFVMVTAAAHVDGGQARIVALPGDADGVCLDPYPRLLALQATGSSSVALRDVRLSEAWTITEDFTGFITRVRPPFLLLQSSFCWGLAGRALSEARHGLGGVNEVFGSDLEALEARAAQLAGLVRAGASDRGATAPIRDLVQLRLECAQLATAAVTLEAKMVGGRGYVTASPTARRLREAAFLPIQAPTEGQLRWELSRSA